MEKPFPVNMNHLIHTDLQYSYILYNPPPPRHGGFLSPILTSTFLTLPTYLLCKSIVEMVLFVGN